jgi:hypothetical protein
VESHWGPTTTVKDLGPDVLNLDPDPENTDPWEDEDGPSFPELDDELEAAEAAGDFLMNSEVLLPVGKSQELARVLCWKRDADGKVMGTAHHNPALDSRVYEVRFPDGRTEELAANVIAEAFMPSVMMTGISISYWMPSWITVRIHPWQLPGTIRSRSLMERRLSSALPMVGSCAVNGRTAVLPGKSCRT